jgi:hypothetical protein
MIRVFIARKVECTTSCLPLHNPDFQDAKILYVVILYVVILSMMTKNQEYDRPSVVSSKQSAGFYDLAAVILPFYSLVSRI